MTNYPSQGKNIDNDFHPVDSGLEATNDHWGTTKAEPMGNIDLEGYHYDMPIKTKYEDDEQKLPKRPRR